jgi:hypothetical protein
VVAQAPRPNIVIIVADDLGYGDIGVHGCKDIPTPSIDSIAQNGVRFTDAYVTGPYCSPTRAGLLTGRYPQRFGHEFNLNPAYHQDYGLPLTETTMATRLLLSFFTTDLRAQSLDTTRFSLIAGRRSRPARVGAHPEPLVQHRGRQGLGRRRRRPGARVSLRRPAGKGRSARPSSR